jgi:phytoene dehydrogenase-like protein
MDDAVDVIVIGGGLAGLTAAATAAGAGLAVRVVDGRPGANRARTDQVGRFRFNRGAHALYRRGAGRQVLSRLGVAPRGKTPPLLGAYGRRGDVVDRLPLGPLSSARTRLVRRRDVATLVRVLATMPTWRPDRLADRTAADWFDDLGLDGAPREIVAMLARTATYVADVDRVSADVVAAQVRMASAGNVEYLHGGWSTLVDGLDEVGRRRGVHHIDGLARAVVPDGRRVRVTLDRDGAEHEVLARAAVVAAGPPDACASVLPEAPGPWRALAPPVRAACLDLGLTTQPDRAVLLGVDRPLYLIRHAPPADLAPPGAAVVHGLRYLGVDETASAADLRGELEEHARLAGIEPDGAEEARYLHRMVVCGALPTPEGGGLAGRPGVADTGLEGVFVAGDWLGREGHLADAALASGEAAGRRAVEQAEGATVHGAAVVRTAGAAAGADR